MCGIWDWQSTIVKDLNDSQDPKHTLFCREIVFVAIYALFSDNKCLLFTRLGGGSPKADIVRFFLPFFLQEGFPKVKLLSERTSGVPPVIFNWTISMLAKKMSSIYSFSRKHHDSVVRTIKISWRGSLRKLTPRAKEASLPKQLPSVLIFYFMHNIYRIANCIIWELNSSQHQPSKVSISPQNSKTE